MKIIQVLNHFLPDQTAGTEVYVWALSKQLKAHGIDVSILIPNYYSAVSESYSYDSLSVYRYAEPSILDRSLILGLSKPIGLKAFGDYLSQELPDIVHFHEISGSNGITEHHLQIAKKFTKKIVITFHLAGNTCRTGDLVYNGGQLCDGKIDLIKCSECYLNKRHPGIKGIFLKWLTIVFFKLGYDTSKWSNKIGTGSSTVFQLKLFKARFENIIDWADNVIVLTNWYKNVLLKNGVRNEKIKLIPQGLPVPKKSDVPCTQLHGTKLRLMFLGRISPFKGLHLLLEALSKIDSKNCSLSIYGQSNDLNYERDLREKYSYLDNVEWLGTLPQNEVIPTMRLHDLLCLCSTFSEMSPLVIQEAFASGLPVIASAVYGNIEQIEHGINGLLFRFNDVESLYETILKCINMPDLIQKFKKSIKEPISFKEIGLIHFNLYNRLLN